MLFLSCLFIEIELVLLSTTLNCIFLFGSLEKNPFRRQPGVELRHTSLQMARVSRFVVHARNIEFVLAHLFVSVFTVLSALKS